MLMNNTNIVDVPSTINKVGGFYSELATTS